MRLEGNARVLALASVRRYLAMDIPELWVSLGQCRNAALKSKVISSLDSVFFPNTTSDLLDARGRLDLSSVSLEDTGLDSELFIMTSSSTGPSVSSVTIRIYLMRLRFSMTTESSSRRLLS